MNWSSRMGVLAGAAIASTLLAGCATAPPKASSWVAPPLGSTFTMMQRNTGSYFAQMGVGEVQLPVTRGERTWEGRQVITFSSPQGTILQAPEPSGAVIGIVGPGDTVFVRWDPPMEFSWPLEVGKTWTQSHRVTFGTTQPVPFDITCKVPAYEDATVPAGTFKVFRIVCTHSTGQEDTFWYSHELGINVKTTSIRSSSHRFGAGTQEQELLSFNIKK